MDLSILQDVFIYILYEDKDIVCMLTACFCYVFIYVLPQMHGSYRNRKLKNTIFHHTYYQDVAVNFKTTQYTRQSS